MSSTIEFFFQTSLAIEEFPQWALESLGLVFDTREGWPYYASYYLQCCLFLEKNRSKEMEDHNLEHLNFRLSVDPASGSAAKLAAFTVLCCTIMSSEKIGDEGFLIYDCQCPLAKYVWREQKLFDELSGVDVKFPQHLTDVFKAWYRMYPECQSRNS